MKRGRGEAPASSGPAADVAPRQARFRRNVEEISADPILRVYGSVLATRPRPDVRPLAARSAAPPHPLGGQHADLLAVLRGVPPIPDARPRGGRRASSGGIAPWRWPRSSCSRVAGRPPAAYLALLILEAREDPHHRPGLPASPEPALHGVLRGARLPAVPRQAAAPPVPDRPLLLLGRARSSSTRNGSLVPRSTGGSSCGSRTHWYPPPAPTSWCWRPILVFGLLARRPWVFWATLAQLAALPCDVVARSSASSTRASCSRSSRSSRSRGSSRPGMTGRASSGSRAGLERKSTYALLAGFSRASARPLRVSGRLCDHGPGSALRAPHVRRAGCMRSARDAPRRPGRDAACPNRVRGRSAHAVRPDRPLQHCPGAVSTSRLAWAVVGS